MKDWEESMGWILKRSMREAVRTALDMSAQFPQAKTVDPNEIIDTSFVKQSESVFRARAKFISIY